MILDDALIFKTLFTGNYSRDDVEIIWEPVPLQLPESMLAEIENYWQSLPKQHIFNGALARLDHWAATSVHCQLVLSPSDYRTLLYSNQHIEHIKESWGFKYLSRALGISVVTTSSDNQIIIMKRSANVGEYPNCYDVFGGHVDIGSNGASCVYDAMAQEIKEEMDLDAADYDLSLIGLIETTATKKPELVFQAQISKASKDIIKNAKKSKDNIEFSNIYSIFNSPQRLKAFLEENGDSFSPSAFGSLRVYMQTNYNRQEREGKRGNQH